MKLSLSRVDAQGRFAIMTIWEVNSKILDRYWIDRQQVGLHSAEPPPLLLCAISVLAGATAFVGPPLIRLLTLVGIGKDEKGETYNCQGSDDRFPTCNAPSYFTMATCLRGQGMPLITRSEFFRSVFIGGSAGAMAVATVSFVFVCLAAFLIRNIKSRRVDG